MVLVKLKILYYGDPEIYPHSGGVKNVAYYLVKALEKKINVTYYPPFKARKRQLLRFLYVYREFILRRFDILHFNITPCWKNGSYLLLKLAKSFGMVTILNIHGIIQIERGFSRKHSHSVQDKGLVNTLNSCRVVNRIVVNSKYMRESVIKWYGISPNKIVVIPNGVNVTEFSGFLSKKRLLGDPAILYLGLLHKIKGVDILIKAIAKLHSDFPKIKVHLVGNGPSKEFEFLAKKEGIEDHVIFHGAVPHSAVACYYKSADICVFPSRHEAFGITILEAMASGAPVIASEIGGIPEIISSGNNGLLFKSEDVEALSEALLTLYCDLDLRRKLSSNAFKTAKKHSWNSIAKKYISLYRQCRRSESA